MKKPVYFLTEEFDRKGEPTGNFEVKKNDPSKPPTVQDFKESVIKEEKGKAEAEAAAKNKTNLLYIGGSLIALYLIFKK